ncbi:MAG: hypothetical protein LBC70_02495 [Chitinispirillales bacterium]|jgi:hypothetical protein|nr:hypothetical protein [Chitinispirillales bacterium]
MKKTLFFLLLLTAAATGNQKQLIEREFRQLETALTRYMHDVVVQAQDFDQMNRALFDFMRDNPGVTRILRVNAGGYIVNDVNASSPRSAPPRDIGNQRWFQQVSQNRRPHYSVSTTNTDDGELILFYAWPLMTGPDRSHFSGSFAATIDFTSQLALIDASALAPFQIASLGVPLFQHDWDNLDYIEEPLDIRGASSLTIRTFKPLPTRLDPLAPSEPRAVSGFQPEATASDDHSAMQLLTGTARIPRERAEPSALFKFINVSIFVLLAAIAAMVAYSTFAGHSSARKRYFREEPPPPPKLDYDKIIIKSMTEKPAPVPIISAPPDVVDSVEIVDDISGKPGGANTNKEQQVLISKILKLMKDEFVIVDKKIEMLAQRINQLEEINRK